MLLAVLSGFILAVLAPLIHRGFGRIAGTVLALLPAGLFVYFASFLPMVTAGETARMVFPWLPGLDINLSFYIDGLSLLFALLISGIGTFILVYGGGYLAEDRDRPRFFVLILAFMASMLGLVLSDNLVALFVFWELTSITSYLLIGYKHEDEKARKSALQGLVVTVGGGLALLAGFIMLALVGGSWELSELLTSGEVIREHALYLPLLGLILLGAFTKSAQFPFHFWLPNAMAAPTPVSAYLHSATMVKAGVYLLARLNPTLGGTEAWMTTLTTIGALTMFLGIFLALNSTGIKRILAFSTIMALGTLTMLVGIGTEPAMIAATTFLMAHSLYKGALFMVAGCIDHTTGTKEILDMGGLRRFMPVTAAAGMVAAFSLAGMPPLFGFIGKELLFEAALDATQLTQLVTGLAVLSAMLVVAVAAVVGLKPFFGHHQPTPKDPHEAPWDMLAGPVVLSVTGLAFGVFPMLPAALVGAAAGAIHGEPLTVKLTLWHGINMPLLLSIGSFTAGVVLFLVWHHFRAVWAGPLALMSRVGPERGYHALVAGIDRLAEWQTRILQNGYMRNYLLIILLTLVGLVQYGLFRLSDFNVQARVAGVQLHEWLVVAVLIAGALFVSMTRSRLAAVATMGIIGFGIALLYVLFSAPDLAITQVLVETLTVLLLVLVLFRLPGFLKLSNPLGKARDVVVATLVGGTMTLLLLATAGVEYHPTISRYFVEESWPAGHGRNIVNVILVDFRALDTLGEIVVISLAAVGVYAMLRFRAEANR
ncbi:MAG: putative monovalent cation/H+ antiporter subunit A [Pseudomonadota bacterium]